MDIIKNSLDFCESRDEFQAYVILENHLHLIISGKYQLWQEGVHPQLIQGEEMMRQKIDYIHHNPVCRGYVNRSEDWVYSSAGSFENKA